MRLVDADAVFEKMRDKMDMQELYLPIHFIDFVIDEMPTIEPKRGKWIPVSERLPEDDTLMLVQYIDTRPEAMEIWIGWHEMENVWYIDGAAHSREYGNEVIAWMPLPEPYKSGGGKR